MALTSQPQAQDDACRPLGFIGGETLHLAVALELLGLDACSCRRCSVGGAVLQELQVIGKFSKKKKEFSISTIANMF